MGQHYGSRPEDGWVKIFNHNIAGGYWSSANDWAEVKKSNIDDPNSNKYSQLYKLNENMKLGNEFVFKMVMDNHTNIWAQTNHPFTDVPYSSTVPGYRAISISTSGNNWGGISRSNTSSSFIDGNPANTNWYYPIGSTTNWNGGLPQYDSTGHPSVELWVKIR
jgi:hypothetical protein